MQKNKVPTTLKVPPITLHGPSIQLGAHALTGMEFDPARPYIYCKLCGEIYQPSINRKPKLTPQDVQLANDMRTTWSRRHNRQHHTEREIKQLEQSGRHLTPEAVLRLVPFGIIPVSDIVYSQVTDGLSDHEQAGLEAPKVPIDDVEQ